MAQMLAGMGGMPGMASMMAQMGAGGAGGFPAFNPAGAAEEPLDDDDGERLRLRTETVLGLHACERGSPSGVSLLVGFNPGRAIGGGAQ